ncbi:DUF4197 domain-containing protein [Ferruginibacter yonginensis]|uniref:DUF4197 domain-containing protein n=1 Tax=Ferruginibacter yonginensis TaxID=1310416 RepID=A0ABV8QWZ2_9BACT
MKKIIVCALVAFVSYTATAQGIFNKINKAIKKDSTTTSGGGLLGAIKNGGSSGTSGAGLSNADIVSGLKDALRVATDSTTKSLSAVGGYLKNEAIKIVMPAEAVKVEKTLRGIGAGALVDKAILSMNTAAENAAGDVGGIFLTAIKQMTVTDGINILRGGDHAATDFLKRTTTATLTEKMRPVIESSLKKVNADKYWNDAFSKYNLFAQQKVNTDLTAYVTGKALEGMFYKISLEETKIRKDPAAQVTDILKKVFGGK